MANIDEVIFDSQFLQIGIFRCPPWHEYFYRPGITDECLLVFPRTSVYITHVDQQPVLANPNVVMFYNEGQLYHRGKLSDRGDLCDWFAFKPEAIASTLHLYDPAAIDRMEQPFVFTHGPSDPFTYLQQRNIVEYILKTETPDPLFIEEHMLAVLARIAANTYETNGIRENGRSTSRHIHLDLVQQTKELIVTRYSERLTLTQIAQEIFTSPYHLSRIFRHYVGLTIHTYLNQVRLRTSLEHVAQTDTPLTRIGHELGYSSHSHFTKAFRDTFGTPPSTFRQNASRQQIQEMSKILIA